MKRTIQITAIVIAGIGFYVGLVGCASEQLDSTPNAAATDHPSGDHPSGDHPMGGPSGDHPSGDHPVITDHPGSN